MTSLALNLSPNPFAAMEIMFGTMRPTAIYRQNTPYFTRYPDFYRTFSPYPYPTPQQAPLFQSFLHY